MEWIWCDCAGQQRGMPRRVDNFPERPLSGVPTIVRALSI